MTGAAAATYYGRPRTTADIDFIVRVDQNNLFRFLQATDTAGLKVDPARIRRQLETGYNVIRLRDRKSAYAADFIIQRRPIQRRRGSMLGIHAYYQTPEALILAKLRMIKATLPPERSLKDKGDILSILANTRVDKRKIERSAGRESTLEIFNTIARGHGYTAASGTTATEERLKPRKTFRTARRSRGRNRRSASMRPTSTRRRGIRRSHNQKDES